MHKKGAFKHKKTFVQFSLSRLNQEKFHQRQSQTVDSLLKDSVSCFRIYWLNVIFLWIVGCRICLRSASPISIIGTNKHVHQKRIQNCACRGGSLLLSVGCLRYEGILTYFLFLIARREKNAHSCTAGFQNELTSLLRNVCNSIL